MLLLFETPAGYSLFKVKDEGKLADVEVRGVLRGVLYAPTTRTKKTYILPSIGFGKR
jgi:hypothetical protein